MSRNSVFRLFGNYSIEYTDSIAGIESSWDRYSNEDIFLQSTYLKTLEDFPPENMQFRYACVMRDGKGIGILYFQVIRINLADSLQGSSKFKRSVASFFETHMLISGNTLVTGDYGYNFSEDLGAKEIFDIVDAAADAVRKALKKEGIKVGAQLKKDYYLNQIPQNSGIKDYTSFQVQPNMELHVREAWKTKEDYAATLKSKYRVRMKRARKKAMDLELIELNVDQLEELKETMYGQYMETVDGAGFNLFYLNPDYNIELKKAFGDGFQVFAYFEGTYSKENLLGYYTLVHNNKQLEAHFLGYDHSKNAKYQSYLNFLYDMVEKGIEYGFESINMSRTAMEIKSSVGAEAIQLKVFMKYNGILNKILPRALDYFVPKDEWKPRMPFK